MVSLRPEGHGALYCGDSVMDKEEIIAGLLDALVAAKEHLDWAGWGDSYERECARDAKLPERINDAIAKAKHCLGVQ